jgi:hypothetical protein
MRMARARTIAGLAAAVIPFAILIHLGAEAVSLGHETFGAAFLVRHVYLGVLFVAAALLFARTVGAGCGLNECRRRCALIRAHLRSDAAGVNIAWLAGANAAFFALSQVVEGVPIASGDWRLGLAAALAGSIVAAFFVLVFARSIVAVALGAIAFAHRAANRPPAARRLALWRAPRRAGAVFSLFVPNRPPPVVIPL